MEDNPINNPLDTICKDYCKDSCTQNCTQTTLFDDCKRCPLNGKYSCNIKSFVHTISDEQCSPLCKDKKCNELDTVSRVLGECSMCPSKLADESEVKCNKTTPEYTQILNNYVDKLPTYDKILTNLENISNVNTFNNQQSIQSASDKK